LCAGFTRHGPNSSTETSAFVGVGMSAGVGLVMGLGASAGMGFGAIVEDAVIAAGLGIAAAAAADLEMVTAAAGFMLVFLLTAKNRESTDPLGCSGEVVAGGTVDFAGGFVDLPPPPPAWVSLVAAGARGPLLLVVMAVVLVVLLTVLAGKETERETFLFPSTSNFSNTGGRT
jgi:hypothetical protein